MNCLLCQNSTRLILTDARDQREYLHCEVCDLRFLHPQFRLNAESEHARYQLHKNEVTDEGYQNFVKPLYNIVCKELSSAARGLDYGCGGGPVLSYLLAKQNYSVALYDPFFYPNEEVLNHTYDFVLAIEVVEHFYNPAIEFARLKKLVRPGGALGLMTLLYSEATPFADWYYRKDPTHVCFYSLKTFNWLKQAFAFTSCQFFGDRTIWIRA